MGEMVVGVDIGSSKVCTVIGKLNKTGYVEILGTGIASCSGVKKGIIVDIENTANAIRTSVEKAESEASLKIGSAYINIQGMHISVINNRCCINISGENREITRKDVERLLYSVKDLNIPEDRQIIDVIPRQFIIDGYDEIIDPVGMVGVRLEVEADVVSGKITSVQNIVKSLERANIKVDGLVVEAFATGEMVLMQDEKEMGVVLIDIGGGITDISVFKNKKLVFYNSIPVGGDHITSDISIGMKISNAEAEKIKRQYELALTSLIKNDQEISVLDVSENKKKNVKVSEVVEIIEARVYEIFSLCRSMLEKSDLSESLSAGIVLTGGGISYVDGNKEIAAEVFDLPVRIVSSKAVGASRPEAITAEGIVKYVSGMHRGSGTGSEVKAQKPKNVKKQSGFLKKVLKFFKEFF